ncbi:MAG TPA: phosphonate ABC transporter ATP-binding protein [Dissulfurispiraceae bacterium]
MLQLKDISVTYPGGITALHTTSTAFRKGTFTVLLGPSGAGKSTLLRCLNLLNQPTSGHITVRGLGRLDTPSAVRAYRRRTAMILKQHQLIDHLTALQNILVGRPGYHAPLRTMLPFQRQEQLLALGSLERVGLLHKALERVDNLSEGEQQRVGIARALVQKPEVILADEPVSGLDPITAQQAMSLMYTICKEDGITAVVSLHQAALASNYADRIIGLANGRIIFDEIPEKLNEEVLADTSCKSFSGHHSVPEPRLSFAEN